MLRVSTHWKLAINTLVLKERMRWRRGGGGGGSIGNLIKGLALLSPLPDSIYLSNCRPVILSNRSDLLTEVKFLQILPLFFLQLSQLIPLCSSSPLNGDLWTLECDENAGCAVVWCRTSQTQWWAAVAKALGYWSEGCEIKPWHCYYWAFWSRPIILSIILWLIMWCALTPAY